jgi:hypothetical protein
MLAELAEFTTTVTTTTVVTKKLTDPILEAIAQGVPFLMIIVIAGFLASRRMVDEDRVRAEPRVSRLFFGIFPPGRILTDLGRTVQTVTYVALGILAASTAYLMIKTR